VLKQEVKLLRTAHQAKEVLLELGRSAHSHTVFSRK
jgi:hypothetical protein